MNQNKRRITMELEEGLLAAVDRLAAEQSRSRNSFISEAIQQALRQVERARIDAEFGEIANDPEYREELQRVEAEMASASNAAWRFLKESERNAEDEQ